jgi:hypothetical protein
MAYQIEQLADFIEIRLSGATSKQEILQILGELKLRDPDKQQADLWIADDESQIAFRYFSEIVQASRALLPDAPMQSKSALVATGAFQEAEFEMYRTEAESLPLDIGIFRSREAASNWLTGDAS